MDIRNEKLSYNLVNYSNDIKEGEKVLIEYRGDKTKDLVKEIIKEVYKVKAIPFVIGTSDEIEKILLNGISEEQIKILAERDKEFMKKMDSYISVRSIENSSEFSSVDQEKLSLYSKLYVSPVHFEERLKKKWVVLRYPSYGMAQSAGMSFDDLENFYYKVCCLDYAKLSKAMENLENLMTNTDKVRIIGTNTDLEFSIKGFSALRCDGKENIPDGEVFTAPVKESVNGIITYNTPSLYQGFTFENVCLEFKNGKIINATANDTERINKIFDTDEGARYIGEFAIGVNPFITKPMKDILFDEKIAGSFHFTPGAAYEEADNGNKSAIHWDLVCIQTKENGGGEIYFDDVLIRKDGIFVLDNLKSLNPENFI